MRKTQVVMFGQEECEETEEGVMAAIEKLMDEDRKSTPLKALQVREIPKP